MGGLPASVMGVVQKRPAVKNHDVTKHFTRPRTSTDLLVRHSGNVEAPTGTIWLKIGTSGGR